MVQKIAVGTYVTIAKRDQTGKDKQSGLYYLWMGGLCGVVDAVYSDTCVVSVDIATLPDYLRFRHENISQEVLSESALLAYNILVKQTDIQKTSKKTTHVPRLNFISWLQKQNIPFVKSETQPGPKFMFNSYIYNVCMMVGDIEKLGCLLMQEIDRRKAKGEIDMLVVLATYKRTGQLRNRTYLFNNPCLVEKNQSDNKSGITLIHKTKTKVSNVILKFPPPL